MRPLPLVVLPRDRETPPQAPRQKLSVPSQAPAGKMVAGGRPIYFAQVYVNNLGPLLSSGQKVENIYAGYLRLKAGWYVDTTVALNGVKQKVGVFDSDSNLQLGDMPKSQTYRNSGAGRELVFRRRRLVPHRYGRLGRL